MSKFLHALKHTFWNEGIRDGKTGYVNHPKDPGGETNWGITKKTAKAWGWEGSMKDIPEPLVQRIYKKGYWEPCKCDKINNPQIATKLFDTAVNVGIRNAVKILQRSVNVWADKKYKLKVDGKIGQLTIISITKTPQNDLLREMSYQQNRYYDKITKLKPWLKAFIKGWRRRAWS